MSTSASELLRTARQVATEYEELGAGVRQRAAAFLARQALEETIQDFLQSHEPGVKEDASMRVRLLCVTTLYPDSPLARRGGALWSGLSEACHHHPFELTPGEDVVGRLIDEVEALCTAPAAKDGLVDLWGSEDRRA